MSWYTCECTEAGGGSDVDTRMRVKVRNKHENMSVGYVQGQQGSQLVT